MSNSENWRIETDAETYFSHQGRRLSVSDRRPVIRRPSDLVGPGINRHATPVIDYNDLLAMYNGYFSSTRAANGPEVQESGPNEGFDINPYAGFIVSDSALGGVQIITNLNTGAEYRRVFRRFDLDPYSVSWGPWERTNDPFVASGVSLRRSSNQSTSSGAYTEIVWNDTLFIDSSTFEVDGSEVTLNKTGLYLLSGSAEWAANADGVRYARVMVGGSLVARWGPFVPSGAVVAQVSGSTSILVTVPGTVVTLEAYHSAGTALNVTGDTNRGTALDITRVAP